MCHPPASPHCDQPHPTPQRYDNRPGISIALVELPSEQGHAGQRMSMYDVRRKTNAAHYLHAQQVHNFLMMTRERNNSLHIHYIAKLLQLCIVAS